MEDEKISCLVNEYLKSEKVIEFVNNVLGDKKKEFSEILNELINKIQEMPEDSESSVSRLLGEKVKKLTMMELMEINNAAIDICAKINIELDYSKNAGQIIGMPYNIYFIKRKRNLCPKCAKRLTYLEPDGRVLYCRSCNCYYKYNKDVLEETTSPYTNPDYIY